MDELLKMNLDTASVKELKAIMEKMVISSRGCLNKADLKEKLNAEIPTLRISKSGFESTSSSHNSSGSGEVFGETLTETLSSALCAM